MAHTTPTVTRIDVEDAIAKCDELGIEEFLDRYGYGPSKRYQLRFGGRSYPSKAILGVAANMTARQFSGGAAHTCRVLRRLGFHVRDGQRRGVAGWMRKLVAQAALSFPWPRYRNPELPIDPVCLFASGSSRIGALRGFAAVGHDVGVVAHAVTAEVEAELVSLAGTDVQVFVDSGAFSEVKFTDAGPQVVAPISDRTWDDVLSLYSRLAGALGDQLHVVAPDMVGHQAETLDRLRRYRHRLSGIAALGARILVPIQKGAMRQSYFAQVVEGLLDFEWMPALPCMKAATTVDEAQAFAARFLAGRGVRTLHLLGLGARGRNTPAYLEAIAAVAPEVQIQMDSVIISAMVGRQDGPSWAGKRRRATHARDIAADLVGEGRSLGAARQEFAIVLSMA